MLRPQLPDRISIERAIKRENYANGETQDHRDRRREVRRLRAVRNGLAEGAIEIRDGKARLVAESYCDGLGACLGECPQDAIRVMERDADAYSEELVRKHRAGLDAKQSLPTLSSGCPALPSSL